MQSDFKSCQLNDRKQNKCITKLKILKMEWVRTENRTR